MTRCTTICLALLACALAPLSARAQVIGSQAPESDEYASPQHFMFEFKVGPYAPNVDDEFSGSTTPYADLFGDDLSVMIKGELDVEIWRPFGTLAVGGVVGYYSASANTFKDDGAGTGGSASGKERLVTETSINLVPVALLLIYRADFLYSMWRAPVIPYVKFGLNYTFWWITKGDEETATFGGTDAAGGTLGWQFNAGISLMLDVFEPKSAKNLDVEMGINHTYLFFEFAHVKADGFGAANVLHVGDTTWQAGLAFEF